MVEKIDRALDQVRKQHPQFRHLRHRPAGDCGPQQRAHDLPAQRSLPICVAFAAVLLALAFRSVFVGLVSLLPGLFPVVASGAIIRSTGGGLEFASVVALLVVFGLAIDALIHFFNRLSLEERAEPRPEVAIRKARVLVGPAIILTTLVLAFGLGVTVFSDLPSLRTVRVRLRDHAVGLADGRSCLPARTDHVGAQDLACAPADAGGLRRAPETGRARVTRPVMPPIV